MNRISKIISGGQTGADVAGLIAAKAIGITTGGHAPKGYRTENGPNLELRRYNLREHRSWEYPPRTEENVKNSDVTIIFTEGESRGSRLTMDLCRKHSKPYIVFNPYHFCSSGVSEFIDKHSVNGPIILNIAGNRESVTPGIQNLVIEILKKAIVC